MALITGSSTTDWSTISLSQVDFETHFVTFLNRVGQILTAIQNPANYSIVSASRTVVVLDLVSGGRLRLALSGVTPPLTTSFSFSNTVTGELLQYGSRVLGNGDEFVTSATIGSTGFSETVKGNIFIPSDFPPNGNVSGSVTSLVVKIGSATVTFSGSLNMTGDLISASLTGTVTAVLVASGANTIKMTGLAINIDVIEAAFASNALSTVSDLFSVVGDQLNGDDLITYTNNSGVGMSFFGGAGNDTINISGLRGDTLNGGAGNDILVGGLGQDTVNGGAGDDQITMLVTAGNVDTIDAGADTDTLVLSGVVGGNGLVVVNLSAADQVVSIAGDPNRDNQSQTGFEGVNGSLLGSAMTVTGSAGDNVIIGSNGADIIDGGDGNDTIIGGAGNDQVTGGAGNDVLNGGLGADTLVGGTGDDTYVIDNLGDQSTELSGEGTDTVQINRTVDLNVAPFTEIEHVVLTGAAALNATGDAGDNSLTGNSGANILTGGDGNDTLTGNAGNDILNGGSGDDAMDGGTGNDVILIGNDADHGVGEVIDGGAGTDILRFTSTTDDQTLVLMAGVTGIEAVVIANAAGLATGTTDLNVDASLVTSGLLMTGNAGDNELTGTGFNDILNGGAGDDELNGGAGTNLLIGGGGNDTFVVTTATDLVSEGLNGGLDTVEAALSYTLGANVENLELTGNLAINGTGNALNNSLTGNDGANVLTGGAGNDLLEGEDGADTVLGGIGNDRIVMDVEVGAIDIADGGLGLDTLALVGTVGGIGPVTVNLAAGAGDQVTDIGGTPEGLLQNNFEHLDASGLDGTVTATGSAGANVMIGSDGVDVLAGLAGNDILNGGAGDDTLDSGDGNDIILIADQGDHAGGEVVAGGTGTDVVRFTNTTDGQTLVLTNGVTGIEAVVIGTAAGVTTGTTALNVDASAVTGTGLLIVGNAGDNLLTGTGGNDLLNGGAGDDTLDGGGGTNVLVGGAGNDTFIVNNQATDLVSEGLNGGIDTVDASLNYTLGANVENLTLTGGALNGTGNALNNVLTGNDLANNLQGGAGHDTLIGGLGEDTVLGGTGNDRIVMDVAVGHVDTADGGIGLDTLALVGAVDGDGVVVVDLSSLTDQVTRIGTVDPELLEQRNFENLDASGLGSSVQATGSAGANLLIGSDGADVLAGLAGNDVLSGGAGIDDVQGGAGNDVILIGNDADHGVGEVIDGGAGTDVLRFTSTTDDQTLVLTAGVTGIEAVVIANAAGLTTGTTDLNVDASAVTSGLLMTGNAGDNELTGTGSNDILNGGAGEDTLDGGAGTNLLIGGGGNDTFVVATATDLVSEGLNGGIDTVKAAINYVLGANVENLELTGTAAIGTGNTLNNVITGNGEDNFLIGNAGNDTLEGEAGEDTVLGGIGNDRIVMDVAVGDVDTADGGIGLDTLALVGTVGGSGLVTVNLAAGVGDQVTDIGGAAESLIQNNFENLDASGLNGTVHATGSAGANLLIGSDGADVLNGAAGNDILNGGAGDDTLSGGLGNDTFLFDAGDGQDLVEDNSGIADVVRFGATIDSQDLVISRQADDLRLAVAGSTDTVTIQNWYSDPVNRTETIQAGDGQTLLSAQVDVLIQAMAAFTTQTGLTWETASTGGGTAEQQAAFQNTIAANWQ